MNRVALAIMALCLALSVFAAERLRPPAVPLATHDPYFSIWSPADKLTDAETMHWTGKPQRLTSLVRIDGRGFRILGAEPAAVPALPQTDLEVTPTRTICTFAGEGVRLTLTFMTPLLPDDLTVCSRPVTYVTWEASAIDGKEHKVALYCHASPAIAVNDPGQPLKSSRPGVPGLAVLGAGTVEQPVLAKKGDDLRIDWGNFCFAVPGDYRERVGTEDTQLVWLWVDAGAYPEAWATHETLATASSPGSFVLGTDGAQTPAMHRNLGRVGAKPVACWLMLAYDDEWSIKYFRQNLRPYWRRDGDDAAALLSKAAADYEPLKRRCERFDAELMADLRAVGGEKYAQLCALAYRQTFAGNKICCDAHGQPLMFPKENFSNGCIGTVDVLFPQAPFFLVFSPGLVKAMLAPILDYAASPRWPFGYAPHDLGTYPHATGQVYGMGGKDGDRMPVEECGNMLIILAALAKHEGNAGLASQYWPMLTRWADYLVADGLDPTNQLCSADMFGHLPRNANLALKAIVGIGGFAQLCELAGARDDAIKYLAIARDYAVKWQALARDDGRTRLAYHLPGTWSMKHNLIWDRVLGLNLFPAAIGDAEIAWYLKVQKKYGLPVDNRTDTSLIDWALWSMASAGRATEFQALLEPIWRYANETPARVPLSDWFVTTDAKRKGFQARPVVGGIFIKLLADSTLWAKWARRGADARGPWAPIPVGGRFREVVPTAQTAQVRWRYTFDPPPGNWFEPGFDDSDWKEGVGGFGTQGTPGAIVGTEWRTQQIWLRRQFTLPERRLNDPRLLLIYDEDPEVYLNGTLAARLSGWSTDYGEADIAPAALATLEAGRNVMAVRASQTYGGQSIDVGIVEDGEPPNPEMASPRQSPADPDFGPNVLVFDPSQGQQEMQARIDAVFREQERAQFGTGRYALLFKPGRYELDVPVGFYTHVAGLGALPGDVTIAGRVWTDAAWMNRNATCNFWRAVENLTVAPPGGVNVWAVSQAAPLRRAHIRGDLPLSSGGWSSGGFMADCRVDGAVIAGSQQQWFARNSGWQEWRGVNWNMVFVGCENPAPGEWPERGVTRLETTPLIREKPYLTLDGSRWSVRVPPLRRQPSAGSSWEKGGESGEALPVASFHIARAGTDTAASINAALRAGKNLLVTPGIYSIEDTIVVSRPGAVVFGLGFPTLVPATGKTALRIEAGEGVIVSGLVIDAGAEETETLVQIGLPGRKAGRAENPSCVHDLVCRVGGYGPGKAKLMVAIHDAHVIGDNFWLWRADHGAAVGWTENTCDTGLRVEGDDVTIYGLFVEHTQAYQTIWNGERGRVYFYQSEMPYDPPSPEAWRSPSGDGYASYKVGEGVKAHEAWGLGVYHVFKKSAVVADNAIETPAGPGIRIRHALTFRLGGGKPGSGIRSVHNGQGGETIQAQKATVK